MSSYRNIILLSWFNFCTEFKLYAPLAIIYFSKVSHSYALGASIFSITMLFSALFDVPTGVFSDRIGRKNTVIYGAICAVLYTLFYALAHSYALLVVGAVFEGVSRSFYSGNNNALLYDTLVDHNKIDRYPHYLGKLSSMFQWSLAVAGLLGGFLAGISFAYVMWLSVLAQIIALIVSFFLVEPKLHTKKTEDVLLHLKKSLSAFAQNAQLRRLSLSSILGYATGEVTYQFQAAFYILLWPLYAIGIAKMLSNVGAALSYHFSGRVIDKYNPFKWLVGSNLYNRVTYIFALAIPTVFSPLIMVSSSLLYGVTDTAKSTLLQKEFSDQQRATMSSLNSFAGSIVFAILAFTIGIFADKIGPAKAMLIIQGISFITLWIYWQLYQHDKLNKN